MIDLIIRHVVVSLKLLPNHLQRLSIECKKGEMEKILGFYKKNPEYYHIQSVCYDLPGEEHTRQYYLEAIKTLFINCKRPQGESVI